MFEKRFMLQPEGQDIPKLAYISLTDVPLVRHLTQMRCGYYTAEWIARAIGMHPKPANDIINGQFWLDMFHPVFPSDMRKIFKFRGMESEEVRLDHMSDKERIDWIRKEIALKKKPPALLIRTTTLHWIAVAGFDDEKQVFYIYTSSEGKSSNNPNLPVGNDIIRYDELARVWRGRWWLKYRAIVVAPSKNNPEIAL